MMDKRKITIRIGRNNLSFTMLDATNTEQPIVYTPYVVKAGITMAVNLRQAFKSDIMIEADVNRADVLLDTPQMLVPIEQFEEDDIKTLFDHAFPAGQEQRIVRYNVLPNLKAVCLFAINKDLNNVINDQFDYVQHIQAMTPVWHHSMAISTASASTCSVSSRTVSSTATRLRSVMPTMPSTSYSMSGNNST